MSEGDWLYTDKIKRLEAENAELRNMLKVWVAQYGYSVVKCSCSVEYTSRKLRDPSCEWCHTWVYFGPILNRTNTVLKKLEDVE